MRVLIIIMSMSIVDIAVYGFLNTIWGNKKNKKVFIVKFLMQILIFAGR